MSIAELTPYTAEDLLTMPDGDRFELVDGQLVEKEMGARASLIAFEVGGLIRDFLKSENRDGWPIVEASFQCFSNDGNQVRKPDVSYTSKVRLPNVPDGHIKVAPDLAVEVISPNDRHYEVEAKVEEYLAAGVAAVWVVNPNTHSVVVRRANGEDSRLQTDQEITGDDFLPGFRCLVAKFFPDLVQK